MLIPRVPVSARTEGFRGCVGVVEERHERKEG
jgi:hypothetical protein